MNAILNIPIELRLGLLFVVGAAVGCLVNLACYRLAWNVRAISPWGPPPPRAARRAFDRWPIVGWLALRREARLHGAGFWIRPALVELALGLLFAALYWWEVQAMALLPDEWLVGQPPGGALVTGNLLLAVHVEYLTHAVLCALLAAATLIDIDEKTIPDGVTTPGTLLGLLLAAAYPWTLLPAAGWDAQPQGLAIEFLQLAAPNRFPAALDAPAGLVLALACWWSWCLAILPLRWLGRRGWRRGGQLLVARALRHPYTWLGVLGTPLVAAVWAWGGAERWGALVTALVGLAAGGGLIWAVRIIGTAVLRREAMGFGDVTLMAMIGTLVGWQSTLVVFFLAPFAGAVVALALRLVRRDREIAYGPFLCLATLILIVFWRPIWSWAGPMFYLGWLVPAAMAFCLLMLGVLLGIWQALRTTWRRSRIARRRRQRGGPGKS